MFERCENCREVYNLLVANVVSVTKINQQEWVSVACPYCGQELEIEIIFGIEHDNEANDRRVC